MKAIKELQLAKSKLSEFLTNVDRMNNEEMQQVVKYMITVSNKHIDRIIEINEVSVKQNEELSEKLVETYLAIDIFERFIFENDLIEDFEFFVQKDISPQIN